MKAEMQNLESQTKKKLKKKNSPTDWVKGKCVSDLNQSKKKLKAKKLQAQNIQKISDTMEICNVQIHV